MARYGRGLICAPVDEETAQRLRLDPMVEHNNGPSLHRLHGERGRPGAHHHGNLRGGAGPHRPPPGGPGGPGGGLPTARAPVPSGGPAGGGPEAGGTHGGGGGSGETRGTLPCRGDLRDHERGRDHGAASPAGGVRQGTRTADHLHRRSDPLPQPGGAPGATRGGDPSAHRLRGLPGHRLPVPSGREPGTGPSGPGEGGDPGAGGRAGAGPLRVPHRGPLRVPPV